MKVKGKVVVVTGAGSGLGQALVLELLRRGARVAAVDLRYALSPLWATHLLQSRMRHLLGQVPRRGLRHDGGPKEAMSTPLWLWPVGQPLRAGT